MHIPCYDVLEQNSCVCEFAIEHKGSDLQTQPKEVASMSLCLK